MECCDDFGKCTQGHGCPVRVSRIDVPMVMPPDADRNDWAAAVAAVFIVARKYEHTVPSHWLDAMRTALLEASMQREQPDYRRVTSINQPGEPS